MSDGNNDYSEIDSFLSDGERVLDAVSWSPWFSLFTKRNCYLTQRRLIKMDKTLGVKSFTDVPLQSISTMTQGRAFKWGTLVVGGLCLITGLILSQFSEVFVALLAIGVLITLYALVTRQSTFTAHTSTKNVTLPPAGRGKRVEEFTMHLREAWNKRNQW